MAILQDEIARLRGILEKRGAGGKRKKKEKKIRVSPEGESITEENDDDGKLFYCKSHVISVWHYYVTELLIVYCDHLIGHYV